MTTYTKTTWVDLSPPLIAADELNNIEDGIYNAHVEIGDLTDLDTLAKDNLVNSINEVVAITNTLYTNIQTVSDDLGIVSTLNTTSKIAVGAINEVLTELGDVTTLTTTATNAVGAINELDAEIGDVSTLNTTATTLVPAINEVHDELDSKYITTNTTYYLATTGNDTTGNGTSGSPWYSPHKVFDYLKDKRINDNVTVTISIADGTYVDFGGPLNVYHPDGDKIEIVGTSEASTNLSWLNDGTDGIVIYTALKLISTLKLTGDDTTGNGVSVQPNANVKIEDVTIVDWVLGLRVYSGYCNHLGGTITSCGSGVDVLYNSTVLLKDLTINNNTNNGVLCRHSSNGFIYGVSNIQNNDYGILCQNDSFVNEISNTGSVSSNTTANYSPSASTADDPTFGNKGSWIYG